MHYDNTNPISQDEARRARDEGSDDELCDALISVVLNANNREWVEEFCVSCACHPSANVRGLVATCIGHIARIHRQLDIPRITLILRMLSQDPGITGRVQDAIDDIWTFMRERIKLSD
jgi:hypothetical protein